MIAFVKSKGGLDYAVSKMIAFQEEALQLLNTYPESEFKASLLLMVNYPLDCRCAGFVNQRAGGCKYATSVSPPS